MSDFYPTKLGRYKCMLFQASIICGNLLQQHRKISTRRNPSYSYSCDFPCLHKLGHVVKSRLLDWTPTILGCQRLVLFLADWLLGSSRKSHTPLGRGEGMEQGCGSISVLKARAFFKQMYCSTQYCSPRGAFLA